MDINGENSSIIAMKTNAQHWHSLYHAECVEPCVFRTYGRILAPKFGLTGKNGEAVLDYGCGAGSALRFYKRKGFDIYGVDTSETAIAYAQAESPDEINKFKCIQHQCNSNDEFFDKKFDLIISVQTLYYLSDTDLESRLISLKNMLKPNGIFYATMMGVQHSYFEKSNYFDNGLYHVKLQNARLGCQDFYINFTASRNNLINKFSIFSPLYVGWYDEVYDEEEQFSRFHWTFMGK